MAEGIEKLTYHTVDQLQTLDLDQLENLYELVETQRRQYYREVYERETRNAGATGSDAAELEIAEQLLTRYQELALVPVGARWARAPRRVQEAVIDGKELIAPEKSLETVPVIPQPALVMLGLGLLFLLMLGFILLSGGGEELDDLAESALENLTPTPRRSPTPTPIALEEQDTIIRDGDTDRALAYPVSLQVYPYGERQPRVFVMQRRSVRYSEWEFDPNPDTASYLIGMSVRRVIGIPWSDENQTLFDLINEASYFRLVMNTGAVLEYSFDNKAQIIRSDTSAFRQVSPGLVLVLIGERDNNGALTATRTMIVGRYAAEQELARDGALASEIELEMPLFTPTPLLPTPTLVPARDLLYAELISVTTHPDNYIVINIRIYNGQYELVTIEPENIRAAFGYSPNPPGPWLTANGLTSTEILPGQALDLQLFWEWGGEPYLTLQVMRYEFAVQF